ncbi:hypothetical protein CBL_21121 [Carabus blaptoides fortunei]
MNTPKIRPSEIRLAFWNANSILRQKIELQEFTKHHNLQLLFVNETFLKPCHRDPEITNYTLYRCNRQTGPGGGTAIFVRRSLEHHEVDTPQLAQAEANTIELNTNMGPIRFVSIYKPPHKPIDPNDLHELLNSGKPTIIASDLNCNTHLGTVERQTQMDTSCATAIHTWTATNNRTDLPQHIRQLIRERNRGRRAWQRHHDFTARGEMHNLAPDIKAAISQHRN